VRPGARDLVVPARAARIHASGKRVQRFGGITAAYQSLMLNWSNDLLSRL
jgi:hypothetical protein